MVQGKQQPCEETGGHQDPPHLQHPQIPREHFFPNSFQCTQMRGKGESKAGAAQDLLIPLPCLPWDGEGCRRG